MTERETPEREPGRSITRRDFEQVIRRAAELAAREGDADELLSADEVVRIGQELGLSRQHVRRAMYELPELAVAPRWYDRYFGSPIFSVSRVVPSRADVTARRVEDYLVTREFLQIVRRRGDSVAFIPADDTISSIARALSRPGKKHFVARASRVVMNVQPLPDDRAHVRFDIDLNHERRSSVQSALALGGVMGLGLGALAAAATAALLPGALEPVPELIAFTGTLVGAGAAAVTGMAASFRKRVQAARIELIGLLDRIEHGESLNPPPAPWRRKLQLRLFGSREQL